EIQAGWWRGTDVTPEARQQTYLTVIGHGMKSLFVYYFNEGNNWGVDWGPDHIKPIFQALRNEWKMGNVPIEKLSNEFWGELQARSDRRLLVGFDARNLMQKPAHEDETLYFDSPVGGDGEVRTPFAGLARIGEKIVAPHQEFLSK